ncbi:MAG: sodium-dependent transporter [Simkaniaceae bacterium]|nr:sodium-dependent transporter [Simkaniaceae bacterium]
MKREHWKSRFGFIWAAVGSAIGLGSIWRFPYVVGENGGATFVLLYLICLVAIGFPVLIAEILIGRKTQLSPGGAFKLLGRNNAWGKLGKLTMTTGFLVSSFYAVIAGWTMGYLIEALFGKITHFETIKQAFGHFSDVSTSAIWSLGYLLAFMIASGLVLYTGVRKGIEKGNKVMMPLLLIVLIGLVIKGLTMDGASRGIQFIFQPDWSLLTPTAILMALGQAFFSLSLGQGTMVTYGSYIKKDENLPFTCFPIVLFGICISLLAGIAIFTFVFSVGMAPTEGESLMFQTLPLIFSKISGGYFLSLLFFLLLFLAAVTSQISALEPMISYLQDAKKWKRHRAVTITCLCSFLLGIPSALSFGLLKNFTLFGMTFFNLILFLSLNILIPLGGLAAVILVGWRWGLKKAMDHLREGSGDLLDRQPMIRHYLCFGIKYLAPLIILFVMLDALGIFRKIYG